MRPTHAHALARAGQIIAVLCFCISLSAENFSADSALFAAYQRQDMSIWKAHIDSISDLPYEYGYCGYLVEYDNSKAKPYVKRFKNHVHARKNQLPVGHYEMYMSAVYVYELRLHESLHPAKAMSLAKEAVRKAPNDPLVLAYYATCLFYAPKPIGSKREALTYFEKAAQHFYGPQWQYCWVREATQMYILQCLEKLKMH